MVFGRRESFGGDRTSAIPPFVVVHADGGEPEAVGTASRRAFRIQSVSPDGKHIPYTVEYPRDGSDTRDIGGWRVASKSRRNLAFFWPT